LSFVSDKQRKKVMAELNSGKGVRSDSIDSGNPTPSENNNDNSNRMLDDSNGNPNGPIGDLDVNQRKAVEEHVESEITNVVEEGFDAKIYEFEDGQEWLIFESFEQAEREVKQRLVDDVESEPELFGEDLLGQFVTISETDKNIIAREDADSQVEDRDIDELKDEAKRFDISFEDPEDKLDEDDPEFDEKLEKANDILATQLREEVSDKIAEEILPQLDDPIQFFVEDQGTFSKEDLLKANFIQTDADALAQFVIDSDGVAPTLASYDGEEVEVDGLFLYRRN